MDLQRQRGPISASVQSLVRGIHGSKTAVGADGVAGFCMSDAARAHTPPKLGCIVKSLPGRRVRVVAQVQRQLKGLDSFGQPLKLRLSGNGRVSLNPFDQWILF